MWQLSEYATARLREELTKLAREVHQASDSAISESAVREAVSLLMDDETIFVSDVARAIAESLRSWAYDPSNPDLLADLLLIHRRSNGLDRDPWSPALAARVMTGLKLLTGRRR